MNTKTKLINWRAIIAIVLIISIFYIFKPFNKNSNSKENIVTDSLIFKRGCVGNTPPCFEIKFSFPVTTKGASIRFCKKILSNYLTLLGQNIECKSIDEFKTSLLNYAYSTDSSYVEYINEVGKEIARPWYMSISTEILSTESIMVIKYIYTNYLGGAHGNHTVHYQNINPRNYDILALTDIVNDTCKLTTIAEQYFIKTVEKLGMKYPNDFLFENDKFKLPSEFAVGKDELILHYNVYEVASYAQGDIVVNIPFSTLEQILLIGKD